ESVKEENYWENEFTETPAWLMQSYIYYYLETKEDAINFYDEIFDELRFCIARINSGYIRRKFFNKLISLRYAQSGALKWWEKVKELEDAVESVNKIRLLPFRNNSQLPTKATVGANVQGNTESGAELISSDLESVLLTLLCCFVYDPETNTYNVDQIPRAQEGVKNLFGMPSKNASTSSDSSETSGNPAINNPASNNRPVIRVGQEIPQEVWSKWSEIIQNIVKGDGNISYITVDGKRMIQPDIFNTLIIMIKLTGIGYDDRDKKDITLYRKIVEQHILAGRISLINPLARNVVRHAVNIFSLISGNVFNKKTFREWLSMSSTPSKNERTMYV
ncbi:hypothetical protein NEAUS03_2483, partial [Nematocida ausubeli]